LAVCLLVACGGGDHEREARAQASYDRYRRPDLLVAALAIRPGDAVADVGAGRGYLTHRLAASAGARGRVVATDIDGAQLAAIGATRDGEAAVETRLVAAAEPSLEPAAYDLILLSEVDHLLPERTLYLTRLKSALKPNGRIAVTNRRWDRAPLADAARAAGLRVQGEYSELPAHFLIFLENAP
jgi:ubiquinone/menaquinone biosynthesis C-methylase UbiE